MKILQFFKKLIGMLKREELPVDYRKTFSVKGEVLSFMRFLKLTNEDAAQLYRANHGGGCPCPKEISNPGFWSTLTENL